MLTGIGAGALGAVAATTVLLGAPGSAAPSLQAADALAVGVGPHLLIDDALIQRSEGLTRVTQRPERLPGPAVSTAQFAEVGEASDKDWQVTPGLVYDWERGVVRMWYWARVNENLGHLMYRESPDGLDWSSPGRSLFRYQGLGTSVVDEGPNALTPSQRYKLGFFQYRPRPMGVQVAFSSDGYQWEPFSSYVLLQYRIPGDPQYLTGVGDIIDSYWDPIRRRYAQFVKMMSADDKEFGLQGRTAQAGEGIRLTGASTSLDFVHWNVPQRVFVPDAQDQGVTEFYGAAVLARGDTLIGLVRILRDDLAAAPGGQVLGIGYTSLAVSRDGTSWERYREPFLDRDPRPGTYDNAHAWVYGVTETPDKVILGYSAYDTGHKVGQRQVGVAWIPRDRFVSRETAPGADGELVTKVLQLKPGATPTGFWVNATGQVRVQVQDAGGRALPGFSFDECTVAQTSALNQPVQCRGDVASLVGQSFQVAFRLRDARLFAFSFVDPAGQPAFPAPQSPGVQPERAQGEELSGALVLYSDRTGKPMEDLVEAFELRFPALDPVLRTRDTRALVDLVKQERNRPLGDVVFSTDADALESLRTEGLLAPTESPYVAAVPPDLTSPDGTWVGVGGSVRALVVNTKLVPPSEMPRSIWDLTDPKWKGKIALASMGDGTSVREWLASLLLTYGEEEVTRFVNALQENQVRMLPNNQEVGKAVVRGEVAVGLVDHNDFKHRLEDEPALALLYPDQGPDQQGTWVSVVGVAMLKNAQNQAGAQKLLDYVLGPEGSDTLVAQNLETPLRVGAGLGAGEAPGVLPIEQVKRLQVDRSRMPAAEARVEELFGRALTTR